MAKKVEAAAGIVEMFMNAGPKDLARLEELILSERAAMEADVAARKTKIDALEALAGPLRLKINGPPPKKVHWSKDPNHPRNKARLERESDDKEEDSDEDDDPVTKLPKSAAGSDTSIRARMSEYVKQNGYSIPAVIAKALKLTIDQVKGCAYTSKHLFKWHEGMIGWNGD